MLIVAANSFGQNSTSRPTPTPDDDVVVKISTNLIQVDVTVTDSNGRIITDLKPDEIEIYENGKKQKITNFSFVSSGKPASDRMVDAAKNVGHVQVPKQQPDAPTQNSIRRTIAIVVDDLSMSWVSVAYTRDALKKFVTEQIQDGDLVAILQTGGSVGALQRYTTDKRILYAAIDRIKYNPMGIGRNVSLVPVELDETQATNPGTAGGDEADTLLAAANSNRTAIFASGTLGSLQYVVSGMREMPGRKSVMLFSDGFDLFERDREGTPHEGLAMRYVRQLIDLANRSAVVFYPIDPRGLQPGTLQPADITRGMNPRSTMSLVNARRQRVWDSQEGINFLAKETGGFAFLNNNDIIKGMVRALDDQSYYLVGYVPDSDTFDAMGSKYNKLEVNVLRKGANVRYRGGFIGRADKKKIVAPPPEKSFDYVRQLRDALISPFAVNGITLRLTSLFGSTGPNDLYVRSLLYIDVGDLTFKDERDGQKTCSFEVLATSSGAGGELVDQIGKTYTVSVPPDIFKQLQAKGLVYHFKFPAKKAGGYQYRVAIRDPVSGKIGAASQFVQVPDLGAGKLTLSSLVLEDMSVDEFQASLATGSVVKTDPMADTALRRIKVGRVYRYSLQIYNARKSTNLEVRICVFRDGKLILNGQPKPFKMVGAVEPAYLRTFGGLSIGSQMEPGDYILQVIVTDKATQKQQIATQFVQFEVVE